jgi:hypothetical protein
MARRRDDGSRKTTTPAAMPPRRTRRQRARPIPRWLTGRKDLDEVAQRRCLMVLSALSGERPVTALIEELGISRGTYYQLETRAILAMLRALAPGAEAATSPDAVTPAARIAELEAKVARLEQDKRRADRLLYLTRKVLPAGPVALPGRRGRPRGTTNRRSTGAGPRPSRFSPTSAKPTTTSSPPASTPTTDGETTP